MQISIGKKWLPRLIIAAIWVVAGLLYTLQSYIYRSQFDAKFDVLAVFISDFSYFTIWGLFSPLIFLLARIFPFRRQDWLRNGFLHLIIGTPLSLTHAALHTLLRISIGYYSETAISVETIFLRIFAFFDYGLIIYFATLFCYTGFTYYQRYLAKQQENAALSSQLAHTQLELLQAQLHPHSLFNTLTALKTLITDDPPRASRMVEQLSDLLRYMLNRENRQKVTLGEEMHYVRLYLELQKTRLGERLTVKTDFPPELENALVPALLLQPIVENAVEHGISSRLEKGILRISVARDGKRICITIADNGPGFEPISGKPKGHGIGLANTRSRLQKLYGNRAVINLYSADGAVVEIAIPFEETDDQDNYR